MIYNIFPIADATIYEKTEALNSGIDALLELNKTLTSQYDVTGSSIPIAYNSRILMKYDYTQLSILTDAGYDTGSVDTLYKIKMYITEEHDLPTTFTLDAIAVSGSWTNGIGRYDYIPYDREGVSWKYRTGENSDIQWLTGSYIAASTGSWNITPGGATWYTGSAYKATASINYGDNLDIEIDCSSIVSEHLAGNISNDGIIIKKSYADEISTSDTMQLQFFSSDTNTIYLPHMRVYLNDSAFNTGSLSGIAASTDNVVYFKNLDDTYTTNDRAKFRIIGRPKFPEKTFATSSAYAVENFLPVSSSYSVEDLHTKEIVIPHDYIYTKINCDTTGSYFNFWMSGLQPERWYKFIIKTKFDNNDVRIYDDGFIFKVERAV